MSRCTDRSWPLAHLSFNVFWGDRSSDVDIIFRPGVEVDAAAFAEVPFVQLGDNLLQPCISMNNPTATTMVTNWAGKVIGINSLVTFIVV
jgi:hypothetical protein